MSISAAPAVGHPPQIEPRRAPPAAQPPPPPIARSRRAPITDAHPLLAPAVPAAREAQLGLADHLGLRSALRVAPAHRWASQPTEEERSLAARLEESAQRRVDSAASGADRLSTSTARFEDFTRLFPSRTMFLPLGGPHDLAAAAYNEATLRLFREYLRVDGRRRGVGALPADTAAQYASALSASVSRHAGYRITGATGVLADTSKQHLRHMRQQDPPRSVRLEDELGLQAAQLRQASRTPTFDRDSRAGRRNWAITLTSHNCLMRGGEPGRPEGKPFDASRGLVLEPSEPFLVWHTPGGPGGPYAAVTLWVWPIKQPNDDRPKVPIMIRRRQLPGIAEGADPMCPYDALLRVWRERVAEVPRAGWKSAPLFARADGSAVDTKDLRHIARDIASAIGWDPSLVGGKSFRIGGASDLLALYHGDASACERFLAKRGRWESDIHKLYSRLSVQQQLEISARLGSSDAVAVESIFKSWWEPR